MADDLNEARLRIRELLAKTAEREKALGRETFLEMPPDLQSQLNVLQRQSQPKDETIEAIMAAEHNLREYNARLDDAFNLKNQLAAEGLRRAHARKHEARRAIITIAVAAAVVALVVIVYRSKAAAKAEECGATPACHDDGLCHARLNFSPFGMECAARDDDCTKSNACALDGRCSPLEGECRADGPTDCARSRRCVERGECSVYGGSCVAGSDDDCRASRACHEHHACTEVQGKCMALEAPPVPSSRLTGTGRPSAPSTAKSANTGAKPRP